MVPDGRDRVTDRYGGETGPLPSPRAVDGGHQDRPPQPAASQSCLLPHTPQGPARGSALFISGFPPDISQPDRRLTVTFGNSLVFAGGPSWPSRCPAALASVLSGHWSPSPPLAAKGVSGTSASGLGGGEKSSLEWRWAQGAGGHLRGRRESGAPPSAVCLRTLRCRPWSHPVPASAGPPGDASHGGPPSPGPLCRAIWVCPGLGWLAARHRCPSVGPHPLPAPQLAGTCPAGWQMTSQGALPSPRETYQWARLTNVKSC